MNQYIKLYLDKTANDIEITEEEWELIKPHLEENGVIYDHRSRYMCKCYANSDKSKKVININTEN
jgi:hypothetical protein